MRLLWSRAAGSRPTDGRKARVRRKGSARISWKWLTCLVAAAPAGLFGQSYVVTTIAGGTPAPAVASATSVSLGLPGRLATDSSGNVYFTALNSVFMLQGGTLTRIAGNGSAGYSGDGGPAASAQLDGPQGLYIDSAGDIYIADTLNQVVREVNGSTGIIATIAGNGTPGMDGDYGPPTQAQLDLPTAIALDASGNVYICDSANNVIRLVANGVIQPYLGNYFPGSTGDGTGTISLNNPSDIKFDSAGNLWIADYGNATIREYGTNGIASTVAGGGSTFVEGGFPLATALAGPHGIALDSAGNYYIADSDQNRLFKVDVTANKITTVAGGKTLGFGGDNGPANAATTNEPWSVTVDPAGNIYFVDLNNARVRMVSPSGTITTVAGNGVVRYSGDGGPAQNALMNGPTGMAYSSTGSYLADTGNHRIRQIGLDGTISTVAGTGVAGYSGDNGPASSAQVSYPQAVAVDASGFLYIADTGNQRVRKVVNGTISTVAGNGKSGYTGDGSDATSATFNFPSGIAVDRTGNIYVSDYGNNAVRKVTPGGSISTIAGNGVQGYTGDGGPAKSAQLNAPEGLAVDNAGDLYIADSGNHSVRIITPDGLIHTFAGNGTIGDSGDGGLATAAVMATPAGVTIDPAGDVIIADAGASRIRMVNPAGVIQTIGGTGSSGYSGDGGPAAQARFDTPTGISADPQGNLYIADQFNNAVRLMEVITPLPGTAAITNAASNIVSTVAPGESVTIYGSGLGPPTIAVSKPDSSGNLPSTVGNTTVYFDGVPAPIFYAWTNQVGVIVPYETAIGPSTVVVEVGSQVSLGLPVTVAPSAPGIYTADGSGKGQAIAVNQTGTPVLNTSAAPAARGSIVSFYVTGVGQVTPAGPDGAPDPAGSAKPVLPITGTVGGNAATVSYAGGEDGLPAGLVRVDLVIPDSVTPGAAVPVVITAGDISSQPGVTIAVQ